eukprot:CAMPEP_0198125224 /NCGR_PEP_ID=MMETSP1442-20131203/42098_1 /TAXON_ID= /ORGANISM="Craspedostauros australis, Strain CCMP3328" /LENGTH=74 /DNA_ID=CAMNT_0043784793 /DNA_START=30 /DNA_END=251 /DNA_ORIENTATION=-
MQQPEIELDFARLDEIRMLGWCELNGRRPIANAACPMLGGKLDADGDVVTLHQLVQLGKLGISVFNLGWIRLLL